MFSWKKPQTNALNELSLPGEVYGNSSVHEVLRCWLTDQGQLLVSFSTDLAKPEDWGMMFADVSKHVGPALESEGKGTILDVRAKMRVALDEFWPESMDDKEMETREVRKN